MYFETSYGHRNHDYGKAYRLGRCAVWHRDFFGDRNMSDAEEAVALKQQGNKAFASHDWPTAIDCYTKAIVKNNKDPSFYCNRAQV